MTVSFAKFALAAALAAATPAVAAERDFRVGSFHGLGVVGPYDVTVTSGRAPGVRAVGEQADLDNLKVEVKAGRLEIGPRERNSWKVFRNSKPVRISVSVASLDSVGLAGSGDITVDRVRGNKVDLSIAGSGNLSVGSVDTRSASLSIAGSGDLSASGRCTSADLSIAGSGDIRAGGLTCQTASASIAGSGDIAINASRTAKISLMGSGDVTVTGGARCSTSKMGSGDVRCG